jgi:hypothetical protein
MIDTFLDSSIQCQAAQSFELPDQDVCKKTTPYPTGQGEIELQAFYVPKTTEIDKKEESCDQGHSYFNLTQAKHVKPEVESAGQSCRPNWFPGCWTGQQGMDIKRFWAHKISIYFNQLRFAIIRYVTFAGSLKNDWNEMQGFYGNESWEGS